MSDKKNIIDPDDIALEILVNPLEVSTSVKETLQKQEKQMANLEKNPKISSISNTMTTKKAIQLEKPNGDNDRRKDKEEKTSKEGTRKANNVTENKEQLSVHNQRNEYKIIKKDRLRISGKTGGRGCTEQDKQRQNAIRDKNTTKKVEKILNSYNNNTKSMSEFIEKQSTQITNSEHLDLMELSNQFAECANRTNGMMYNTTGTLKRMKDSRGEHNKAVINETAADIHALKEANNTLQEELTAMREKNKEESEFGFFDIIPFVLIFTICEKLKHYFEEKELENVIKANKKAIIEYAKDQTERIKSNAIANKKENKTIGDIIAATAAHINGASGEFAKNYVSAINDDKFAKKLQETKRNAIGSSNLPNVPNSNVTISNLKQNEQPYGCNNVIPGVLRNEPNKMITAC